MRGPWTRSRNIWTGVTRLRLRLQSLVAATTTAATSTARKTLARKLSHVERNLHATADGLGVSGIEHDLSLVELHREQLIDVKKTLASIHDDLLALNLEDDDDLFIQHTKLERLQFDCSHKTKKLLGSSIKETPAADGKGSMKLPKLNVPTFDGDLLNWSQFWEQFSVSVHERKNLSDTEKLVYLQQAVKKGSAKNAIEGLTRTADSYAEAISCLKARYDRPCLIYRTHVQKIMDAPSLREGSGKELRCLYDAILQHIRALKTMDGDLTCAFLTSIIELKLDPETMFEWQKHSQEQKTTAQYEDILGFIDLRAQASETAALGKKQVKVNQTGGIKPHHFGRNVTSFAAHADSKPHCVLCEPKRHPLYACPKFKGMALVEKLSTLQDKHLCKNCLGGGHFA